MPEHPWFDLEAFRQDAQNSTKLRNNKLHKDEQARHLIPVEQAVKDVENLLGSSLVTLRIAESVTQKNAARLKLDQQPDLPRPEGLHESTWVRLYITEDHLQIMAQFPDGPSERRQDHLRHALHDPDFFKRLEAVLTGPAPSGMKLTIVGEKPVLCGPEHRDTIHQLMAGYTEKYGASRKFLIDSVFSLTGPTTVLDSRESFVELYQETLPFLNAFAELMQQSLHYPDPKGPAVDMPETPASTKASTGKGPENLILYGPPGTGKTHQLINEVVRLLSPQVHQAATTRQALKEEYERLQQAGQVEFVTFHQNFSYEDFVEGVKAEVREDGQVNYQVKEGVFKTLATAARRNWAGTEELGFSDDARIWKISVDGYLDSSVRKSCLENSQIRISRIKKGREHTHPPLQHQPLEEARTILQSDASYDANLVKFINTLKVGDMVVFTEGEQEVSAIGVVTSDVKFDGEEPNYEDHQFYREVRWLARDLKLPAKELNKGTQFQYTLLHRLGGISVDEVLQFLEARGLWKRNVKVELPHVMVIDEINRGNVSRIFGELITLLEPSKRLGAVEELSVRLPYSKEMFAVPSNLHVIGTMNTADKSLARLDIALRRRFTFKEVPPEPGLLQIMTVGGIEIDLRRFLFAINKRIELLFDRDHTLGHAYLMHLGEESSLEDLAEVMQNRILPLLQEYFFDNWGNIRRVLRDHKVPKDQQFILEDTSEGQVWLEESRPIQSHRVNTEAFLNPFAYTKVYEGIDLTHFGTV